ncbi:MAG: thioredoxin domain-containing protein, partial [Planctomycetes bacterium]|nr:thioredoxin domain-containing protein [Planctomycetota bacterium]
SIGYSSCHWCHVMERESFEDPEIARVLNERFVSIKVDREERPDLDAIYMEAVQMLNQGRGGWPMSVFLTPERKPFYGGTYFPPRGWGGMPGFGQVLVQLAEVYRTQRGRVEEAARSIAEHLAETGGPAPAAELPGDEVLEAAVEHARRTFDPAHGGFGPAPKFPRSVEVTKLLWHHARSGGTEALRMAETTLDAMALGGMYDQIGGGFHRYSTDARWLVPHFEKMLYDNALLARTYVEAFQVTGKEMYRRIAGEVLDYVLREMTGPEGGFYSATDADSEGEEGRFFVWTPEEVEAVLVAKDARLVCERYGITAGGNFEGGRSIPSVARTPEQMGRALGLDPAEVEETLRRGRAALYEARERRVKPFRDEKVIAAWNGLMVSALARAYQVLEEERWLEAAERAAAFILEELRPGGRLHRTWKDGRARHLGYLDDHACLAEALLDLYEATFELEHLERAREIMDALLEGFWDPAGGGFFFTSAAHERLIARRKDPLDNATPSGNGVAALTLLRLERLTGEGRYKDRAVELLKGAAAFLERVPMAMSYTILALELANHPPAEVAVVGDLASSEARALLRVVRRKLLPGRVLAAARFPGDPRVAEAVPLLRGKTPVEGRPAAYLCQGCTCRPPVTDPARLDALLAGYRRG